MITSQEIQPSVADASGALITLYSRLRNYNAIALKVHTNGLPSKSAPLPSVLGISAARFTLYPRVGFDDSEKYERFYFPRESYRREAILKNGLDRRTVLQRRGDLNYPEYFDEDVDSFVRFCESTEAFLGFNLSFDAAFLPWLLGEGTAPLLFDLMTINQNIVCAGWNEYSDEWKLPNFREAIWYYFDCPLRGVHGDTMYAVKMMMLIFSEMRDRACVHLPRIESQEALN